MSKNIYESKLIDLIPENLRGDPDLVAAAASIDKTFYVIADEVNKCIILPNIFKITDHSLLDLLAWDRNVDYYESSLSTTQKQELINNSFRQQMKKGTPSAIEDLIRVIFGDGEVVEWFSEEGLEPYTFIVRTSNESATNERAEEFLAAINSAKNKRSHLVRIEITASSDLNLYFAGVLHIGDYMQIRQVV